MKLIQTTLLSLILCLGASLLQAEESADPMPDAVQPEGSGTAGDPYLISNLAELRWITDVGRRGQDGSVSAEDVQARWSAHYRQTAHIDAAPTRNWGPLPNLIGWLPIGRPGVNGNGDNRFPTFFQGFYDGGGFEIRNLYLNNGRPSNSAGNAPDMTGGYNGLFGEIYSSNQNAVRVQDLRLVDVEIIGGDWTGGLVGHHRNGIIQRVSVSGEVRPKDGFKHYIGGIIGRMTGGTLQESSADVKVYLEDFDGQNNNNNNIGGLVGQIRAEPANNSASIRDVWAKGDVRGSQFVGGLVGGFGRVAPAVSRLTQGYSLVEVEGASFVGPVVGGVEDQDRQRNLWYLDTLPAGNAFGNAASQSELQTQSTFSDPPYGDYEFNFATVWMIDSGFNDGYPILQWQGPQTQTITFASLGSFTYGDANVDLTATASSGLTVSYVSDNPSILSVSGSTLQINGVGTATITASQSGNEEYAAAEPVSQTIVVNPRPITLVDVPDTLTKVYDGNPSTVELFDLVSLDGVLPEDDSIANIGFQVVFASADAGEDISFTFSLIGSLANRYILTGVDNVTGSITPKALTFTGGADNKVYDGTTAVTLTGTLLEGVVGEDDVNVTGALADADVETDKPVTLTLTGTDSANYTLTDPTLTIDVTQAPLTVTADNFTILVGGDEPDYSATFEGLVAEEVAGSGNLPLSSLEFTVLGDDPRPEGTYTITPSGLSGDGWDNYAITYVPGTLTVTDEPTYTITLKGYALGAGMTLQASFNNQTQDFVPEGSDYVLELFVDVGSALDIDLQEVSQAPAISIPESVQ